MGRVIPRNNESGIVQLSQIVVGRGTATAAAEERKAGSFEGIMAGNRDRALGRREAAIGRKERGDGGRLRENHGRCPSAHAAADRRSGISGLRSSRPNLDDRITNAKRSDLGWLSGEEGGGIQWPFLEDLNGVAINPRRGEERRI